MEYFFSFCKLSHHSLQKLTTPNIFNTCNLKEKCFEMRSSEHRFWEKSKKIFPKKKLFPPQHFFVILSMFPAQEEKSVKTKIVNNLSIARKSNKIFLKNFFLLNIFLWFSECSRHPVKNLSKPKSSTIIQ